VAKWGERRHHPILMAWQLVAERRLRGRRRRWTKRFARRVRRVTVPRGMDQSLWGLPVDLLVAWAEWVFRQWPGAPIELVLPAGTPELLGPWYERARPVAELAVKTWVPFSQVDDILKRAAAHWVRHLTTACDGGGAPLAAWFEKSAAASGAAVSLRLGDASTAGPSRGRRAKDVDEKLRAGHVV
jgi:hypothetical protein